MNINDLTAILLAHGPRGLARHITRLRPVDVADICSEAMSQIPAGPSPRQALYDFFGVTNHISPIYSMLCETLTGHGPQYLEGRIQALSAYSLRTLLNYLDIRGDSPLSDRDRLRNHFGLNTFISGEPLGEYATVPPARLEPQPTPLTGPIVDLNGNDVPPSPLPKRLWGETITQRDQVAEILGLKETNLEPIVIGAIADVYLKLAYETGPTALNKAVIEKMIQNAKDNQNIGAMTKMVRDQEIVSMMTVLRSSMRQISLRFPSDEQLGPRFIYKRGTCFINISALNKDRFMEMEIDGNFASWATVATDFHRYQFLYKRDPSVTPMAELQKRMKEIELDIGTYARNVTAGKDGVLSKITGVFADEFNGRITIRTASGAIPLSDNPTVNYRYYPKFNENEVVKVVRESKARRKALKEYRGGSLNQPMKIDRIFVYDNRIYYDTIAFCSFPNQYGGYGGLVNQRAIRRIPEELLIKANRTKVFGSI